MAVEISLEGRVALVTGGTRGIGKAIVEQLLEAGARVLATGTNENQIKNLNKENKKSGLTYLTLNLNNPKNVKSFIAETLKKEQVDVLINNAGINIVSEATKITDDDFLKIQEINVHGPFLLATAFGEQMIARDWGRIVNIASRSMLGRKNSSVYAAAKAGLVGFTKSWAIELAPSSITVNCVAPGPIETEMFNGNNPIGSPGRKSIMDSIPMNRLGDPREVASAVIYFLSKSASFTTGQTIFVCGGASVSQQHF